MPQACAMTLSVKTLGITTFSIMTLSMRGFYVTLSISDTQHKRHSAWQHYHYAQHRYARCHVWFIIMLNVVILSVTMLSVVAPTRHP